MSGRGKKPAVLMPREMCRAFGQLSKAALLDIAWGLAQLGTDESTEQIAARLAEEVAIVCVEYRHDHVPEAIRRLRRPWGDGSETT